MNRMTNTNAAVVSRWKRSFCGASAALTLVAAEEGVSKITPRCVTLPAGFGAPASYPPRSRTARDLGHPAVIALPMMATAATTTSQASR